MSWPFRILVLSVALLWVVAPQIACFVPDHRTAQAEDCCQHMAGECHRAPDMAQDCCRTDARDDVATVAKHGTELKTQLSLVPAAFEAARVLPVNDLGRFAICGTHAPPHDSDTASLILRI